MTHRRRSLSFIHIGDNARRRSVECGCVMMPGKALELGRGKRLTRMDFVKRCRKHLEME